MNGLGERDAIAVDLFETWTTSSNLCVGQAHADEVQRLLKYRRPRWPEVKKIIRLHAECHDYLEGDKILIEVLMLLYQIYITGNDGNGMEDNDKYFSGLNQIEIMEERISNISNDYEFFITYLKKFMSTDEHNPPSEILFLKNFIVRNRVRTPLGYGMI